MSALAKTLVVLVAVVILLCVLFSIYKYQSVEYKAHSALRGIYRYCQNAEILKINKGVIPRTENELCQALFQALSVPNSYMPAQTYSDVDLRLKSWNLEIVWTPSKVDDIAYIKDGNTTYILKVNGDIIGRSE